MYNITKALNFKEEFAKTVLYVFASRYYFYSILMAHKLFCSRHANIYLQSPCWHKRRPQRSTKPRNNILFQVAERLISSNSWTNADKNNIMPCYKLKNMLLCVQHLQQYSKNCSLLLRLWKKSIVQVVKLASVTVSSFTP